jgi:hypothetical protein
MTDLLKHFRKVIKMWELTDWGDRISWFTPGFTVDGHMTPTPKAGDFIFSKMGSGRVGVYKIISVKNCKDPRDMFFADVEAIDYEDELQRKGYRWD